MGNDNNSSQDNNERKLTVHETLASEIIGELKAANRRIFIALMVTCAIICLMIGVIVVYFMTPEMRTTYDDTYTVSQDVGDISGDDTSIIGVNVDEADSNSTQEENGD